MEDKEEIKIIEEMRETIFKAIDKSVAERTSSLTSETVTLQTSVGARVELSSFVEPLDILISKAHKTLKKLNGSQAERPMVGVS